MAPKSSRTASVSLSESPLLLGCNGPDPPKAFSSQLEFDEAALPRLSSPWTIDEAFDGASWLTDCPCPSCRAPATQSSGPSHCNGVVSTVPAGRESLVQLVPPSLETSR